MGCFLVKPYKERPKGVRSGDFDEKRILLHFPEDMFIQSYINSAVIMYSSTIILKPCPGSVWNVFKRIL